MSKSSIKALMVQIETGNMKSNEAHILKFIKERTELGIYSQELNKRIYYSTLVDLENYMTAKQSTITSRVSHLEDIGIIYTQGSTSELKGPGGEKITYSCFYYESRPQIREANEKKRKNKKFRRVVEHLLDNYSDKLEHKTIIELKKDFSRSSVSQTKLF